ncbi:MAG: asparaginase domain-containing protein, partial [Betaproteobacteria bacterium]
MPLPRIRLLVGPGTLPSRGKDRMDFTNYRRSGRPRMTAAELLAELPEIEQIAGVEAEGGAPHEVATPEDLCRLALRLNELLRRPDLDGLVFVQGTNTLEETAYFLTLTVRSAKPVVVTGAQRPFTALSSDAPLNLFNAIRTAAHPDSRGK